MEMGIHFRVGRDRGCINRAQSECQNMESSNSQRRNRGGTGSMKDVWRTLYCKPSMASCCQLFESNNQISPCLDSMTTVHWCGFSAYQRTKQPCFSCPNLHICFLQVWWRSTADGPHSESVGNWGSKGQFLENWLSQASTAKVEPRLPGDTRLCTRTHSH